MECEAYFDETSFESIKETKRRWQTAAISIVITFIHLRGGNFRASVRKSSSLMYVEEQLFALLCRAENANSDPFLVNVLVTAEQLKQMEINKRYYVSGYLQQFYPSINCIIANNVCEPTKLDTNRVILEGSVVKYHERINDIKKGHEGQKFFFDINEKGDLTCEFRLANYRGKNEPYYNIKCMKSVSEHLIKFALPYGNENLDYHELDVKFLRRLDIADVVEVEVEGLLNSRERKFSLDNLRWDFWIWQIELRFTDGTSVTIGRST